MELVLGQQRLVESGGSETYLLTVGEQLQRLGHEVTIFALDLGGLAEDANARGLRVAGEPAELPDACDAVLAQDGVVSLLLAERYAEAPQVYVAHAPGVDLQRPVQLDGVVSAVVALNDVVAGRLDGLARQHEIVRMRQPVDVHRFAPRSRPRARPETALLVSNYLDRDESAALERTCAAAGIRLERIGRPERESAMPEIAMAEADIVFGHGRGALEGMSMGRAVYVLHRWGLDGWVTSDSYPALEADGFGGNAYRRPLDHEQLGRDLEDYRPELGAENRRLAFQNHHALDHARELVVLVRRLSPSPATAPTAPLREMARLIRLQWQTDHRCDALLQENAALRDENAAVRAETVAAHDLLQGERAQANERLVAARLELEGVLATRRYRLGALLARPLDALRGRSTSARNASTSAPQTSAPEQAKTP